MSTSHQEPDVKARLINAAIRLLAEGGPEALQARKLAAEVGASTMAVYTHFGGMGRLVDAVAQEGFRRLSANLARVQITDDPVADIFALAVAYRRTALENPQLYAVTFGLSTPDGKRAQLDDITTEEGQTGEHEGGKAFAYIVEASARAIDARRFRPGSAFTAATQLWSALHGYVTLECSGLFGTGGKGIDHVLGPLSVTLAVGLGDTVEAAERSRNAATAKLPRIEG
jgi:AcrR family transcriptional regulator